jgi:hypothetical protein
VGGIMLNIIQPKGRDIGFGMEAKEERQGKAISRLCPSFNHHLLGRTTHLEEALEAAEERGGDSLSQS